ncbi:hypothetical protein AB0K08_13660 [Citricoccus sp. NPDC055426]|uniref:hypothetical protein n=1 Tax=Citricoccus sp. NPDC055426 TaxID=3155536 RepID=UPI0034292019
MSNKAAAAYHPNKSPHLGPDCRDNKHPACDGRALNIITDEVTQCGCHCHQEKP